MKTIKISASNYKIREMRLSDIKPEKLFEFCSKQKEPILITGLFDAMPELSQWSPQMMRNRLDNKTVTVRESASATFAVLASNRQMPFNEYVDTICSEQYATSEKRLYMQQQPIDHAFPELKQDVIFDQYLPADKIFVKNLWFGPGGNTSPLHFDPFDNFFLQLYGSKTFYLFDPRYYWCLYPGSCFSTSPHVSAVDPVNVDPAVHPKSLKSEMIEIQITAGTALFLPSYWWHQVFSEQLSISINIWLKTNFFKLTPGAINMMPLSTYALSSIRLAKFKEKWFKNKQTTLNG